MKYAEARRLRVRDRVEWNDGTLGTVTQQGYNAVMIAWDDGQIGTIHLRDMQDVKRPRNQSAA